MTIPSSKKTTSSRIVFIGPECSGKTTVVHQLAPLLNAFVVPEYFRFYWEAKRHRKDHDIWTAEEFLHMAAEQNRFEDLYAEKGSSVLLCDTCALQVAVWHYRYLGSYSQRILNLTDEEKYDRIFLCRPDMPFVQDGARDGEKIRHQMFEWFGALLSERQKQYVVLEGPLEQRIQTVLHFISGSPS